MAMRPVTDHAHRAVRINPRHVTHVVCFTEPTPDDPEIPERMSVGLVTGEKLTFCYRTPEDASHAARQLAAAGSGESAYGTPDDVQPAAAV